MHVAICVPCSFDQVPRSFWLSFTNLVAHNNKISQAMGIKNFTLHCNPALHLSQCRNWLAEEAVDSGAEWTLWLDVDMSHPPDLLQALLTTAHQASSMIVSARYYRRAHPFLPVDAYREGPALYPLDDPEPGCYEVDVIGFGAALVNTKVFKDIGIPCFYYDYDLLGRDIYSEDVAFCRRAQLADFKIIVDTRIECGHLMSEMVTRADWNRMRPEFQKDCRSGIVLKL